MALPLLLIAIVRSHHHLSLVQISRVGATSPMFRVVAVLCIVTVANAGMPKGSHLVGHDNDCRLTQQYVGGDGSFVDSYTETTCIRPI